MATSPTRRLEARAVQHRPSGILGLVVMRWLLIALLVSLGGLLLAAAGVARHVWLHRKRLKQKQLQSDVVVVGAPEESE